MKIPAKKTIERGIRVLGDVYEEIDRQIGAEQQTQDDKVSDTEVAAFLSQRGAASDSAGAAVATFQAYMRHVADAAEVPVAEIKKTLGKVGAYIERDREQKLDVADMKPTWRALALFSREVSTKRLTGKKIVADRSARPIGDVQIHADAMKTIASVFDAIGDTHGGGAITVDAVRAFIAQGPDTVATAKDAVRRVTRYLEQRTGQSEFSAADVEAALGTALGAMKKNADGSDDRNQLARTWRALAAFTDENLIRKKDAAVIVGAPQMTPAVDGPKANTVEAFQALDIDVKAEILEDYGNLHGHYVGSGEMKIAELPDAARAFAEKMQRELNSIVGDFEDDSGVYGTLGGSTTRAEVITLPSGDIVGGRIWMHQDGFNADDAPPDANGDTPYHFDTAAEAEAAGVDSTEDINWQVHGLFEVAPGGGAVQLGGSYGHVSDHWEWSGY